MKSSWVSVRTVSLVGGDTGTEIFEVNPNRSRVLTRDLARVVILPTEILAIYLLDLVYHVD